MNHVNDAGLAMPLAAGVASGVRNASLTVAVSLSAALAGTATTPSAALAAAMVIDSCRDMLRFWERESASLGERLQLALALPPSSRPVACVAPSVSTVCSPPCDGM